MASEDKTEQATPRRKQKAREQGRVARSHEVAGALIGFAGLLTALWGSPSELQRWRSIWKWTDLAWQSDVNVGSPFLLWTAVAALRWILIPATVVWGLAVVSCVAQGGLVFATEALIPKPERLSPANKLRQIFSVAGLAPIAKSLIPFSMLLYLGITTLNRDGALAVRSGQLSVRAISQLAFDDAFEICWKSTLVLLLWSGIDYCLQRQKLNSDLRMSKQEVREEYRQNEGNPAIKARLRRLQRQMRRGKMLKQVEQASVVITNPTHFAVALEYRPPMPAPMIAAKGTNALAEQIKQVARWHKIPIVENPPLAQALFRTVEIGQTIPAKLYAAVAEVLAFVYRAQMRAQQARNPN